MNTINCIDRNGNSKTFFYTDMEYKNTGEVLFKVYEDEKQEGEFFQFNLKPCHNELRVTMMNHHSDSKYIAKGIPDALIRLAANKYKKDITSSTNKEEHKCFKNEYRTDKVAKVFQRLGAVYDKEKDLYIFKY